MPLLDYNCFVLRTPGACVCARRFRTVCTYLPAPAARRLPPVYDRFPKEQRKRCFGECNYSIHFVTPVELASRRLKGLYATRVNRPSPIYIFFFFSFSSLLCSFFFFFFFVVFDRRASSVYFFKTFLYELLRDR